MGAVISVGGDYWIDMSSFDFYVGDFGDADVTSFTSTQITGYVYDTKITVKGSGFKVDKAGYLVSGTLSGITATEGGQTVVSLSGVAISVAKIIDLLESGTATSLRAFVASTLAGKDVIRGGIWDDIIYGHGSDDKLYGRGDDDRLYGGNGSDYLHGGDGTDRLFGDAGNDTLFGTAGADMLYGGAGADTFSFKYVKESTASSYGRDTIYDFSRSQGDKIDLRGVDASTKAAGDQAFSFIGAEKFHGKAGELRFQKGSSDTYIYADVNGDGVADFGIRVTDPLSFTKGDFLL
jgi:Ca2+-binding RTX toxin-like protein